MSVRFFNESSIKSYFCWPRLALYVFYIGTVYKKKQAHIWGVPRLKPTH